MKSQDSQQKYVAQSQFQTWCCLLQITVKNVQLADGKMIPASKFGQPEEKEEALVFSDDEKLIVEKLKVDAWLLCNNNNNNNNNNIII